MTNSNLIFTIALGVAMVLSNGVPAHPELGVMPKSVADVPLTLTTDLFRQHERDFPRHPPGNIRAADFLDVLAPEKALVKVWHLTASRNPKRLVSVSITMPDGSMPICTVWRNRPPKFHQHVRYPPAIMEHDGQSYHGLLRRGGTDIYGLHPSSHDPKTGDTIGWSTFRTAYGKRFVDWSFGHYQRKIPRMVYDRCPDFPSPEELGLEVNEAQTAWTYPELVAQHRGDRILFPVMDPNQP